MEDMRGQGGAEYILLFGAVIIIAVAAIFLYQSYFSPYNNNSLSLEITNPGSSALNVMYEVRSTNVPSRVNKSSAPTEYFIPDGKEQTQWTRLNGGQTIKLPIPGNLKKGDIIYVEVGVQKEGQSVVVTLLQGKKVESWNVMGPYKPTSSNKLEDYLKSGGVIKSITISENISGLNASTDINSVRLKI
jgi:hypothetical protein